VLALGARNLVLIGDQAQLPPFTACNDTGIANALIVTHGRSLLERAVLVRSLQSCFKMQCNADMLIQRGLAIV
jgi:hypothetical protein